MFSWDEIAGNDNGRLIEYLTQNFDIDWVKTAKIEKIDDDKTIRVSTERNSLSLRLSEKTKVNLKIDDGRSDELFTKTEDFKLNIIQGNNELYVRLEKLSNKWESMKKPGVSILPKLGEFNFIEKIFKIFKK